MLQSQVGQIFLFLLETDFLKSILNIPFKLIDLFRMIKKGYTSKVYISEMAGKAFFFNVEVNREIKNALD